MSSTQAADTNLPMNRLQPLSGELEHEFPLKIVHVIFTLNPGGLENGVVNIANQIDPKKFSTSIICLDDSGGFAKRLAPDVVVVALERKEGFRLSTAFHLGRALKNHRADLIHTHNLGPLLYSVLAKAMLLTRAPIIHGEHGTLHGDQLSFWKIGLRKVCFLLCHRIHTVSESLRQHLIALHLPSRKLCAIPNGVDCEKFYPPKCRNEVKRNKGFSEDSFIIGIVGRFIPSKKHLLLLEALDLLSRAPEWKQVNLLILGDKGEAKQQILEAIEKHPAKDRIHWKGHVEDPFEWYQIMDLLACPSSEEGLSNALLESMASGVPCLAHPACGANEVITSGKDGILKDISDPEIFAKTLEAILSDVKALTTMGENARETIVTRHSISSMISKYEELYQSSITMTECPRMESNVLH